MSGSTASEQIPDLTKTYGAAFVGLLVTCLYVLIQDGRILSITAQGLID